MSAGPVLRPVAAGDAEACFALDRLCFPPDIAFPLEEFAELADTADVFLVAEQDDRLTGFVVATFDPRSRIGVIVTLDVAVEHRRRGLGERLLIAAHGGLAQRGATGVFLHVGVDNDSARGLYEKCGYVTLTRFGGYYGRRRDALLMTRTLDPGEAECASS